MAANRRAQDKIDWNEEVEKEMSEEDASHVPDDDKVDEELVNELSGNSDVDDNKVPPKSPKPTPRKKTPARRGRGRPRKTSTDNGPDKKRGRRGKAQTPEEVEIEYLKQLMADEQKKLAIMTQRNKDLRAQLKQEQAKRQNDSNSPDGDDKKDSQAITDLKKQLDTKIKRVKDLEKDVSEKDEIIAGLKQESTEKDNTIVQLRETLDEQNETSKRIVDKFVSVRAKETKETRNSVVWVLDRVHEPEIRTQLPKDTLWELFPVDSVSSLKELEESEKFRESLAKATVVILMVGTSDLQPGSKCGKTSVVFEYIAESCDRLKGNKPVAVVTIPPCKIPMTLSETPFLNSLIVNKLKPDCLVVDNQEAFSGLPKRLTLTGDGVSLSSKGAEIMVDSVMSMMSEDLKTHRMPKQQKDIRKEETVLREKENSEPHSLSGSSEQVLVDIPAAYMKHVVGKGKKTIERLGRESSTVVEIHKYMQGNLPKEAVKITGDEHGCKKAVDMIHQIIKDQKAKDRGNPSNPSGVCGYYLDGKCTRGERCPYKHPRDLAMPKMIKFD